MSVLADRIVGPYDIVRDLAPARRIPGFDDYEVVLSRIGDGMPRLLRDGTGRGEIVCGGHSREPGTARTRAAGEALERYLARTLPGDVTVRASARSLGADALDWTSLPRCSDAERAAGSPIRPFDPDAEIPWILGTDLTTGTPVYVPRSMVVYRLPEIEHAEAFCFQISTGHAVHTSPSRALFGGLAEVVERDMIALTWLQRLPLRRIQVESLGAEVGTLVRRAHAQYLEVELFDSRNEYGLPAVYCLVTAPNDARAHKVLGSSAALTFADAAEKAILEAVSFRSGIQAGAIHPAVDELGYGAVWAAARDQVDVFDFLARDTVRPVPEEPYAVDEAAGLERMLGRARELGHRVYAVERRAPVLDELGLSAYAVVVPDLMPFTPHSQAQFRGHDRLYAGPGALGHPAHEEEDLNPWPQPFA